MKKIMLLILVAATLCSCSKDKSIVVPADGQYIAHSKDLDLVICMIFENEDCICFIPFISGEAAGRWDNVSTSGHFPNYVYQVEDLTIKAKFESTTAFTATLSGVLSYYIFEGSLVWTCSCAFFDSPISFKLDNQTLDANGDGILDEMQPDLFQ